MIENREPYDPAWVVELARRQHPADHQLLKALQECTQKVGECRCGCGDPYFVDSASTDWEPGRCVELTRSDQTTVIVDVLADGRVGHIEIGRWGRKR